MKGWLDEAMALESPLAAMIAAEKDRQNDIRDRMLILQQDTLRNFTYDQWWVTYYANHAPARTGTYPLP